MKYLSYAVISLFAGSCASVGFNSLTIPACTLSCEIGARNRAHSYKSFLTFLDLLAHQTHDGRLLNADIVDRWFARRLQPEDVKGNSVGEFLMDERAYYDSWQHPYRAVRNKRTADGAIVDIGVYSLGADGLSLTGGEDYDDINSWSESWRACYSRRELIAELIDHAVIAPPVAGLVFGVLVMRSRRRPRLMLADTHSP